MNFTVCLSVKGSVSRVFRPPFFHDSNPSRPLIDRLNYFRIRFRFHRDIRILKKLRSVHPTAESDSAMCIIPQCASYCGVRLRSVHYTTESDSAVGITPQIHENKASEKTPQCVSYCRVGPCGVHHTAESSSALCITPRSQ